MASTEWYWPKSLKEQFRWNSQNTNEECNILLKTALECGKYDALFKSIPREILATAYLQASIGQINRKRKKNNNEHLNKNSLSGGRKSERGIGKKKPCSTNLWDFSEGDRKSMRMVYYSLAFLIQRAKVS